MKILTALCLAIFTASTAWASAPRTDTVAALIHLEHAWLQASLTGNKHTLNDILAPAFLDTSDSGALSTKADVLAGMNGAQPYNAALSDLRVRVFGDAAIVTGIETLTGPHGEWAKKIRYTDFFVKRGDHWQAVGAQENLIDATSRLRGVSHQKPGTSTR